MKSERQVKKGTGESILTTKSTQVPEKKETGILEATQARRSTHVI